MYQSDFVEIKTPLGGGSHKRGFENGNGLPFTQRWLFQESALRWLPLRAQVWPLE